ncbi:hypothetical protein NPIL_173771, partial [Nephila pilipes]
MKIIPFKRLGGTNYSCVDRLAFQTPVVKATSLVDRNVHVEPQIQMARGCLVCLNYHSSKRYTTAT